MTPLGLLGPLSQEWFKNNKILGCPHPHIPSGMHNNDESAEIYIHIYSVSQDN